ncbi:MBL fold metallo-hydrolase [uncultured Jannaschia sp.]|uniref:MBL fold metallo-hydrolase n=1 Tax=uncultured Jannaschia sp. TaxID=293347 RepID=UPI0026323B0A|nr:MBL fold metallo-hydrolase [uncultured Jannaschia sp.]
MTLTLTVHRGTRTIGGSCIEIAGPDGERLILDAGLPLDAPRGMSGLLPESLDLTRPATLLISHAHLDHWGLLQELPANWTVWSGAKTAELIRLSAEITDSPITRRIQTWHSRSGSLSIGGFTVTPTLTDHSAPDAYMLRIEGFGRRILYTGDFRVHGRKSTLVEKMIAEPPKAVDVLLMEGTNLGTDKPVVTEKALEDEFVALAKETRRHVFVSWSAQNVDRTVTLFRAARRTGRNLVVDLYGADVLRRIVDGTDLPVPGPDFPDLRVLITPSGKRLYTRLGREDYVTEMATKPFSTSRKRLAGEPAIIMLRDSMLKEFEADALGFTPEDAYVFSSWSGYLDPGDPTSGWARARAAGAKTVKLHTSGHAGPKDLSRFASAIAPKALVPVHGLGWDDPGIALPPVRRLADGEVWALT